MTGGNSLVSLGTTSRPKGLFCCRSPTPRSPLLSPRRSLAGVVKEPESLCEKGDRTRDFRGPVPLFAQALRPQPGRRLGAAGNPQCRGREQHGGPSPRGAALWCAKFISFHTEGCVKRIPGREMNEMNSTTEHKPPMPKGLFRHISFHPPEGRW